jgi:hypothetical protein
MDLEDGLYHATFDDVPYVCQFASPERVYDYLYNAFNPRSDPRWQQFGAQDVENYAFWCHRACAIACLKMAIETFTGARPTLWDLVQEGLALGGYKVHDSRGRFIDEGWYHGPLIALGELYGLEGHAAGYVSDLEIARLILEGWLVAPTVTPRLGDRGSLNPRGWLSEYGGHLVLVYAFEWSGDDVATYHLHNPSGRYDELRAGAQIGAGRFREAFAHRLTAFRKAPA